MKEGHSALYDSRLKDDTFLPLCIPDCRPPLIPFPVEKKYKRFQFFPWQLYVKSDQRRFVKENLGN